MAYHAVEFGLESVRTAEQAGHSFDIVLNREEVLPGIALADFLGVGIGVERFHKRAVAHAWLEEGGGRVVGVGVVAGTLYEFVVNVGLAQMLCQHGYGVVVECVFEGFRHLPVVTVHHRHIAQVDKVAQLAVGAVAGGGHHNVERFFGIDVAQSF